MPDRLSDSELDVELRRIAEALVAEAPAVPPMVPHEQEAIVVQIVETPSSPQRASRRRGPLVAAAAAAVVAALGVAVAVSGLRDGTDVSSTRVEPVLATEPSGPQRLVLEDWPGEVLDDGTPVALEIGDLSPTALQGRPDALADGRHVLVGIRQADSESLSEAEGDDFPFYLLVVGADGSVEIERRVDIPDTDVGLVAATPSEAILVRYPEETGDGAAQVTYLAHDLTTGEERVLVADELEPAQVDVSGDDLVFVSAAEGSSPCGISVTNVASGLARQLSGVSLDCTHLTSIRLSPDGTKLAIAYEGDGGQRLAIVDVRAGRVESDELLGENVVCPTRPCRNGTARQVAFLGMAWNDEETVRVALADLLVQPDIDQGGAVGQDGLIVEPHPAG